MDKNVQKVELIFFLLYPLFATYVSLTFHVNVLIGVTLFQVLPAIYLSFRVPARTLIKSSIFSAIFVPLVLAVNYVAHKNEQWIIPDTMVPFYIDGVPMFEVGLWAFSLALFTVLFYEYFLDHHFSKAIWYKKTKYLLMILIASPLLFLGVNHFWPIPYFYLVFGFIGMLIPIMTVEFKLPGLMAKFVKVGMYFFYLTFLYEIVALKLGHWYFPVNGKFIGWVNFFGERFPAEEFIFWFALCAMATLSYYEYFDDDAK